MSLKYIADGFQNDAELLLNEFSRKESSEFSYFAAIWTKRNFCFIYMGRETAKEMSEFTNEIFLLSSNFLTFKSIWLQIGSTFLLYALYRNQILQPHVRIRIELTKFEILKQLFNKAIEDKLRSLHYVLDYLFQNALEFIAFPTLLGPCVRFFDKSKSDFEKKLTRFNFKCTLEELQENKVLANLNDDFYKYEKLQKIPPSTSNRCKNLVNILNKLFEDQNNIACSNINFKAIPAHSFSRRNLKVSKKVRCDYSFLVSGCNQVDEPIEVEDRCTDENFPDAQSGLLVNNIINEDGSQPLEWEEHSNDNNVKKNKKRKSLKQGTEKTRRIRQYYSDCTTNAGTTTKVLPEISEESLLSTDSED